MRPLRAAVIIGLAATTACQPQETAIDQSSTGPDATPPAGITAHAAPYPRFGEIERLEPALDALIPPGAELELLAEGFDWIEGPVFVADGEFLLFSEIPLNAIYRWSARDGVSRYLQASGYDGERTDIPEPGSNGLALDRDGALLLAEHGNRRISRLPSLARPDSARETLADRFDGRRLNSPNDLIVAANGDIYFTDPPYGLAGQLNDPEKELDFQGVYLLRRPGNTLELLAEQSRPNGLALSPDGRRLYVANSDPAAPYIYVYPRNADGSLGTAEVFFDAGPLAERGRRGLPDGMAVDAAGNLWATGPGGVLIIDPAGRHLGTILTGQATANCSFDAAGRTLYITADSRLARLSLD